jgi:heme exporter protein A
MRDETWRTVARTGLEANGIPSRVVRGGRNATSVCMTDRRHAHDRPATEGDTGFPPGTVTVRRMTSVSTSPGITTRGLARRFGPRWALGGIDLDLPQGAGLMITGANGSGKTTLLRCLATALAPHQGSIEILGQDVRVAPTSVRERLVFVSHATRLYDDLTAMQNLEVWARLGGLRANPREILERVGLPWDRPEPVRAFSAGMRRRVAFAIALLKSPQVWLLDEPLAALDPQGREMITKIVLSERARGATLVVATHHPAHTATWCDRAIHLEKGVIVWSGAPQDAPRIAGTDLEDA